MTDRPALILPSPPFLSDPALQAVLAALPEARLVGGCVRDALAGQAAAADIDLATPRPPNAVMQALAAVGLRGVATGLGHGTVTAISDHRGFEVTTLRRDVETDGRHAVVAFTDDWRVDAARRDFTMNAMSMDATGAVFDYFDGIADLRAGRVRFVGTAAARIAEDALRILRFFRFQARYGQGAADADAVAAIAAAVPSLARLSCERVWSELKRILAAPDPMAAVRLMARLGVLAAVLPEGASPERLARLGEAGAPPDPLLRLAALLDGDAQALAERLRLSGAERGFLLDLRTGPALPPDADAAALRRALADTPREVLAGRVWLACAGDSVQEQPGSSPLPLWEGTGEGWPPSPKPGGRTPGVGHDSAREYRPAATPPLTPPARGGGKQPLTFNVLPRLAATPTPVFPLHGRDLQAAGMQPGPQIGEMLRALRTWWLDGGCVADAQACRAELARRLAG